MNHKSNDPVTSSPSKSSNFTVILLGAIMVVAIGVLAYSNIQKSKELAYFDERESMLADSTYIENAETSSLRTEMESAYQNAIAELESLKGTNTELNSRIEAQQAELVAQKDKIDDLLKDSQQLAKARTAVKNMKVEITGYLAEIENMKAANLELTNTNTQLNTEKQELTVNLQQKETENTQLNEVRATLATQNEDLTHTVKVGSAIKVKDLHVDGLKVKSNGKLKEKDSAKSVDELKVCFTTVANDVAKPGPEEFYVRIVNPTGETLAQEDLGSGTIVHEKTGEEVRFTQAAKVDFNNEEENLCMTWDPASNFVSGRYTVEIYNKGYLSGSGNFNLK